MAASAQCYPRTTLGRLPPWSSRPRCGHIGSRSPFWSVYPLPSLSSRSPFSSTFEAKRLDRRHALVLRCFVALQVLRPRFALSHSPSVQSVRHRPLSHQREWPMRVTVVAKPQATCRTLTWRKSIVSAKRISGKGSRVGGRSVDCSSVRRSELVRVAREYDPEDI